MSGDDRKKLMRFDRRLTGLETFDGEYASAEALAQASMIHDAVVVGHHVWVPKRKRLKSDLVTHLDDVPSGYRAYLAMVKNFAGDVDVMLSSLANDPDVYVRLRVAGNPKTPKEVSEALRKIGMSNGNVEIASMSPWLSPADMETLMTDPNDRVRENIARNKEASPHILRFLSFDASNHVRSSVAGNKNTPPETLVSLAKSEDKMTRFYVADNNNTPHETLVELTQDGDKSVRSAANNKIRYKASQAEKKP